MNKKIKKHHILLLSLLGIASSLFIFWYQSDANKNNVVIRDYEEAKDYAPVVSLIEDNLFWISERRDFSAHRVLSWKAPFDDETRKGEAKISIAEYNNETAGFIAYFKNGPTQGFIWLLGVDKKFRGLGLGEALMRNAIKDLKKQKAQYITIATRAINKPALSLYKKLGFVEQDTNERGIVTLILKNL